MNKLVPLDAIEPPWEEAPLPDERVKRERRNFPIEHWRDIAFTATDEWLIKRILPRQGLAAIYGKPGSFKSFVALHIALCVALGRDWSGRRTTKGGAVYIAAEGAAGLRKRKAGYVRAWDDLPHDVDFALVPAAPNFGASPGDLPALIAAIKDADIAPAIVIVDTIAKAIGAADENGAGMTAFVGNAGALAEHLGCLVLAVHHVGLGEDAQKRMRGHSSLHGALDAQIFCERREGENAAILTLAKLKEETTDVRLTARLSRVVVGLDEDGDEASTLIVEDVTASEEGAAEAKRGQSVPRSERLLRDVLAQALDEAGENLKPFANGPTVRAVDAERIRERYYTAIAETADGDEDPEKIAERRRRAFNRSLKKLIDAKEAVSREIGARRLVWLP